MARYNKTVNQKLHKEFCEIEGCEITDPDQLHWHHIVEKTEINTSNNPFNIAILCANHHEITHSDRLKIIGIYPSTNRHGRKLVYILDGKPNIEGITEPYFRHQPKHSSLDHLYEKEKEKTK